MKKYKICFIYRKAKFMDADDITVDTTLDPFNYKNIPRIEQHIKNIRNLDYAGVTHVIPV